MFCEKNIKVENQTFYWRRLGLDSGRSNIKCDPTSFLSCFSYLFIATSFPHNMQQTLRRENHFLNQISDPVLAGLTFHQRLLPFWLIIVEICCPLKEWQSAVTALRMCGGKVLLRMRTLSHKRTTIAFQTESHMRSQRFSHLCPGSSALLSFFQAPMRWEEVIKRTVVLAFQEELTIRRHLGILLFSNDANFELNCQPTGAVSEDVFLMESWRLCRICPFPLSLARWQAASSFRWVCWSEDCRSMWAMAPAWSGVGHWRTARPGTDGETK